MNDLRAHLFFRFGAPAASNCNEPDRDQAILQRKLHEIRTLIDEIKAPTPTCEEVLEAVEHAGDGELTQVRTSRIAAHVMALYRAR